jgi:hypothetical protein
VATLKKIPDTYLTPARQLPEQEAFDLHVGNPEAARLLIGGSRQIRAADPPHDHGQDGGEVLLAHPPVRLSFGPVALATGTVSGSLIESVLVDGVPSFSAALGPRLMASAGVFVAGGVQSLEGYVLFAFDSLNAVSVIVTLRPYGQTNKDSDRGLALTQTLAFTPLGSVWSVALSFADLTPLGDVRYDREYELCIWQNYSPPAVVTFGHRVTSIYLDAGTPATVQGGARDVSRLDQPRQSVSVADIKAGAILGQDVGRKMRSTHNALLRSLLGRAPGLLNSDDTPDLARPYLQEVHAAHQHRGIDVPDGCGGYWSDGAVLRDTLFADCLCVPNPLTAPVIQNEDYRGFLVHSSGALDATWVQLEYRASIPAGLGAIDLRFCLETAATQIETRLLIHADVRSWGGVSICTGLVSGNHRSRAAKDAGGLYVCEVDPLDNEAFEPSRKRRLTRKGLWTLDARRLSSLRSLAGVRSTAHQISEVVRLNLTHPKINPTDKAHATADYRIILRFEVQITGGATVVDPGAELRWVLGVASRGF